MPFAKLQDVELYYEEYGSGDETIVFSHGLLFDHRMWELQVAHFSRRYRCIAYDHRGQGRSTVTDGGYDMDSLCADAVGLFRSLNLTRAHFVGLSMGGFVGMRLAARHPQLIDRLVLMETSADPEVNAAKYNILRFIFSIGGARLVSRKVTSILFGRSSLADPSRNEIANVWRKRVERYPTTIVRAVDGVIQRQGVTDELAQIHSPTLILVGDEDVAPTPDKAKRIHAGIPGSVLNILPEAGHSSCLEVPDEVNRLIGDFLGNTAKN
jgi:pimeloyl-ACP methyl ester carboxylesterase